MNDDPGVPSAQFSEPPALVAAEARLRTLRFAGALLGIAIVIGGAYMVMLLFTHVLKAALDPGQFKGTLDKWEVVIRGNAGQADQYLEKDKPDVASDDERPKNREMTLARSVSEVLVVISRPTAMVFLLLVVALLVGLATSVIEAGAKLISLAVNEQAILRKVLREAGVKK